ncbi:MAG: hypothetical protein DMG57_43970 [Acidobacteria bacterium]|nr:MAG: hypothetical protein DMG57_43970 [Acidobacteriota bacterium]
MKLRIRVPRHSLRLAKALSQTVKYTLFVSGILCLGWCGISSAKTNLYQHYEGRALTRLLRGEPVRPWWDQAQLFGDNFRKVVAAGQESAGPVPKELIANRIPVRPAIHARSSRFVAAEADLVGRIDIPAIHISAVVLEGVSASTLRLALGHIPGTARPGDAGNVGIAGHRDTFFRGLSKIAKNDEIVLTTLNGSYRYRVESLSVVGPVETSVLEPSPQPSLTLVTCYPFHYIGPALQRFIVRAYEVSQP